MCMEEVFSQIQSHNYYVYIASYFILLLGKTSYPLSEGGTYIYPLKLTQNFHKALGKYPLYPVDILEP